MKVKAELARKASAVKAALVGPIRRPTQVVLSKQVAGQPIKNRSVDLVAGQPIENRRVDLVAGQPIENRRVDLVAGQPIENRRVDLDIPSSNDDEDIELFFRSDTEMKRSSRF